MNDQEFCDDLGDSEIGEQLELEIKKDFLSLLKVPVIKKYLYAQVEQTKEIFKKPIKSFFLKDSARVIPFPQAYSSEFTFELKRIEYDGGGFKWKAFFDHDIHLPVETILPVELIDLIAVHPVDGENTGRISDFFANDYSYNVYFIKALSDYILGIVQRVSKELRVVPDNFIVFDTTQFTDLPEKQKLEIFEWYLKNCPSLRKKILFEFFVNILPDSEELRNMM